MVSHYEICKETNRLPRVIAASVHGFHYVNSWRSYAVRGSEAVRDFLTRDLFEGFDQFRAEPLAFEDLGDAVLVTVRYVGRGESSGIELDQTFATLYRLRDGKAVSMRDYPTRAEALEAAGLSE